MKLRKCLSVSSLLRILMMNGCWILSDDFFLSSVDLILWLSSLDDWYYDLWLLISNVAHLKCILLRYHMWFFLWIVRFLFSYFVGDFASMFMRGICGQFFSLNLFMRFWYSSVILTSQKGIRRCSFCFYFLGEIVENCYHFFLKFLIEFISGNLWVCYCLYWKLISYRLNFFNRYRPIQSMYFSLWKWC